MEARVGEAKIANKVLACLAFISCMLSKCDSTGKWLVWSLVDTETLILKSQIGLWRMEGILLGRNKR